MRWFAVVVVVSISLSAVAQEVAPPLFTFSHGDFLKAAYLSPNETRLVTVGSYNTLKLWDLTSGEWLAEHELGYYIQDVLWSADGSIFVTRSWGVRDCADCLEGFVHIFNSNGDEQAVIENEDGIGLVQFNPDNTQMLLLLPDSMSIYDLNGELTQTLPFEQVSVLSIHWYADDHILFSQLEGSDWFISVWDVTAETEILRVPESDALTGSNWQAERTGLTIFSVVQDNYPILFLFDTDGQLVDMLTFHPTISRNAVYRSDDAYFLLLDNPVLASDTSPGVATILDSTGRRVARISDDDYIVATLWNGEQTQLLLWAQGDSVISVWTPFGEQVYLLPFEDYVRGAVWSGDSAYILGWSYDHTVRTFTASDGGLYRVYPMDGLPETAMFNSDQSRILGRTGLYPFDGTQTLTGAHEARLWSLDRDLLGIYPHEARMLGAAWIAGESRILTWSEDGVVKVWAVPAS